MAYLCVLATMKNETMNLKVWIDHYLWQGADHIYLIDNGSTDNPMKILKEYIDKGLVTYEYKPEKHRQKYHYRIVANKYDIKSKYQWVLVCDLDEFMFGTKTILIDVLKKNEQYDIILTNWLMFGFDGHVNHPKDIRLASTHREEKIHELTKYFANLKKIDVQYLDIHLISHSKNKKVINDEIHLNHYPIQSVEFFSTIKAKRGDANSSETDNIRDIHYFYNYNKNTTYEDTLLFDIITKGYPVN